MNVTLKIIKFFIIFYYFFKKFIEYLKYEIDFYNFLLKMFKINLCNQDNNETIFYKIYKNYKLINPIQLDFQNDIMNNKLTFNIKKNNNNDCLENDIHQNELYILNHKKGREKKKPSKKIHSRYNCDNIKSKIKTHFHSFIIGFLNKIAKEQKLEFHFKKIGTKITKNITISFNKELLEMKIKDIIKNVSNRYFDQTSNKKIIESIEESNNIINKYLNMTYMEMYQKIYLSSKSEIFQNELNDDSFEGHLKKIKKLYGIAYYEKFNLIANNFVNYFINNRKKKNIKRLEKDNNT